LAVKFTVSIRIKSHSKLLRKGSVDVSRDCRKLVRDAHFYSLLGYHIRICAPWSVSAVHLCRGRGFSSSVQYCSTQQWAWPLTAGFVRSDGSFEYQFLIDNTVYRYFKFTLSPMVIILQCRYFECFSARRTLLQFVRRLGVVAFLSAVK